MSDSLPPPPPDGPDTPPPNQGPGYGGTPLPPPPPPGPAYGSSGYGYAPPQQAPPNNLVWGILTTIFCCLPFGIVSIVYAAKVDGQWASGQYALAEDTSRKARMWAIVAAAVSLAGLALYFLAVMLFGIAGFTTHSTGP